MQKLAELLKKYDELKALNLSLDMTRGKPDKNQLDLSMPMMDVLSSKAQLVDRDGNDCRNYGNLIGLTECRELIASMIELTADDLFIFGNSSLNIMYECMSDAMIYGIDGCTPWAKLDKVKWLCPVPGYDRHFAICEHLGIEMINVPLKEDGPDMDMVEELIKDPAVKGIWCVPKYSNPTGQTYSDEVVDRFARLKPAAKDFRIYWDNAYSVHHLYEDKQDYIPELLTLARKYHNEDIVYKFTSTSKISFPGSGIAALAASQKNLQEIKSHLKYKIIGFDKVNQLRHTRFFKDLDGIKAHMKKHADILRPKFELIENTFAKEIGDIASWSTPLGGYFLSLYVDGIAKEVIARCKECGLKLTEAGCAYPYHKDPTNSHIRIAPSYMLISDIEKALEILTLSVRIEHELKNKQN